MTFIPSEYGEKIRQLRHTLVPGESWEESCKRVATQIAKGETPLLHNKWADKFFDILIKNYFMPGGRIWYGAGRPRPNMMNCFVVPVEDSREAWGKLISDTIIISGLGGGVGTNYSKIRPKGAEIKGTGGYSSGSVSLMRIVDQAGQEIRSGGSRRAALMMALNYNHPDIERFLDVKLDLNQLNNANISVLIDDIFIEAVKADKEINLEFNGKVYKKIKAKLLYKRLLSNSIKMGEPGFIHIGNMERDNNIWYERKIDCTNPCVVGSTLIATADGRNAVSIEQLTLEGKDILVYSTNVITGKVEIKTGYHPRKTGIQKEIWKLTLDDGTIFKATPNHKILKKDMTYCELKDLKVEDSIMPFYSFENNGYRQISNTGAKMKGGLHRNRRQYRLIYEFYNSVVDGKVHAIHHLDCNNKNDNINNLMKISHKEHMQIHNISGDRNPMRSNKIDWNQYHINMSKAVSGEKNGRYIKVSNDELLKHGKIIFKKFGKLTRKLWDVYKKEHNLPHVHGNFRFGSFTNFKNQVCTNHKVKSIEFIGYEDVYNITVEDNHNYHVITSSQSKKHIVTSGICVKNCGELPLPAYQSCCLGHIVLPRFVSKNGKFDFQKLAETIIIAVRFLDNVIDINQYPLDKIKQETQFFRRIGLGIMGLHDMLLLLGLNYTSDESLKFVDKLMNFIKKKSYEASTFLAVEKGSFPKFNKESFLKGDFIKNLSPSIRTKISEYGIRNSGLNTCAPTGTTGSVCGVSGGVEPIFAVASKRKFINAEDEYSTEVVVHPLFEQFIKENKDVSQFQSAHEITPKQHIEMQKVCQKHIDGSISKTININANYDLDSLEKIVLDNLNYLKGLTFYLDGSRGESPLTPVSIEEARKAINKKINTTKTQEQKCRGGKCDI